MKLMIVFGTRPEVIKLAPVVAEGQRTPGMEIITCSTGQHRQMLDQALACFGIQPDIELDLMRENQTLPSLTALLLEQMTKTLQEQRPDAVMVQGDTTTAFTAALAAFYQRIPVAHVEAGLRTGDPYSPFPEEINRAMIARMAKWHFTPTDQATRNLLAEGISASAITQCGNTVIDAVELIKQQWTTSPYVGPGREWFPERNLVLVTTHRRENFGEGLENICSALLQLCKDYPELGFVFPVHLNPQVQQVVRQRLHGAANLMLTGPVDFETSLYLQSRSTLILTDSGGIQEEAPSFGVPCVVMREHTERSEGIDAGFATLAGTGQVAVLSAAKAWLENTEHAAQLKQQANPYGDGQAALRIFSTLTKDQ
ncbi:UDP-N-acetylglucosamine 2-epimerase (non-hydrolyzing) [Hydrogenophaga sp. PAMC20947]|uniref:non-hydrolyzing UDP-N-acetylglucosamine 2-epimerase n=1 Tax=Hydrogenophaga sp. PAMC20947 TaxID=2565558 RepID=UPI00109E31B5|nr:UDP-N-acetylglucosamine 2-epimerase (non-hydrolyzing) [Hydrogenophaga sp. PAMC20947]QCB46332.1 UDP-N-acetylglucosamine 2-epimerase (non-hydrolyzing) [Hydrogenophaga sp. PAMC20947]